MTIKKNIFSSDEEEEACEQCGSPDCAGDCDIDLEGDIVEEDEFEENEEETSIDE